MASGGQEAADDVCCTRISPLTAKNDKFGGIIIDESRLPSDDQTFIDSLRMSLELWRMEVTHHTIKLYLILSFIIMVSFNGS